MTRQRYLPGEPTLPEKTQKHPCYSRDALHNNARIHLPVAPRCNIGCNYCNRKYDCLNESRPGVTSEVLTPEEAYSRYIFYRNKVKNLSVAGVAGPGDALADWANTRRTLELIRNVDQEVIFCLSTNGLKLPDLATEVVDLGVSHVTVTVNCLEPSIGEKLYQFVNYRGIRYEGREGSEVLIENQLQGIEALAGSGVAVKVNIVMIEGINDYHIPEVVRKVKKIGAFMTNIVPLIPVAGSLFQNRRPTPMKELNAMRLACQEDLRQMYHCRQCRADAVGLLGEENCIPAVSGNNCRLVKPGLSIAG